MGDSRVLSSYELMHAVGDQDKHLRILRWHNLSIAINKILTLDEYIDTVMAIVDSCRRDNGDVSIELLDFSTRVNVVSAYAHVTLPEDLEDLYYLLYSSDLYDFVCSVVNRAQINAIKESVRMILFGDIGDNDG